MCTRPTTAARPDWVKVLAYGEKQDQQVSWVFYYINENFNYDTKHRENRKT